MIQAIAFSESVNCLSKVFKFYVGEDRVFSAQLALQNSAGCQELYDLTGATEIEVIFPGTELDISYLLSAVEVVIDSNLLGKIHVDLPAADLAEIMSGTVQIKVTKAGKVTIFIAESGVERGEINNC